MGTLRAVVAYAGGLETDEEVVPAIEAGVAYWTEIYAAVGITLEVEYTTIDMDPELPYTNRGADEYQAFMEDYPGRRVLMVIGDTIADDPLLFGEAGGIPGPYYASPIGAVEIAWVTHADTSVAIRIAATTCCESPSFVPVRPLTRRSTGRTSASIAPM